MRKRHVHKFSIDKENVGTCSVCGEVRQYPIEKGGQVAVLVKGKPRHGPGRPPGSRSLVRDPADLKNGRLPQFPEFSEEWPQVIKVKWLEVYGILSERIHKGG
jgi:hypothetical protein